MGDLHFGCCLACRAPFMQSTEFYNVEETQAVFYLQMRFKQLSAAERPSLYTGVLHSAHILSAARYSFAFTYAARRLRMRDMARDVRGSRLADADKNPGNCFSAPYVLNRRGAEPDPDRDEEEEAMEEAVEAGREAARAAGGGAARVPAAAGAAAAAMWARQGVRRQYLAHWPSPAPIDHAALRAWLEGLPAECYTAPKVWQCDLNLMYPCCSLCNTIFDTWARASDVLRQLVPTGAITLLNAASKRAEGTLPRAAGVMGYKGHNVKYMAAAAAHYLHASWKGLDPARAAGPGLPPHPVYRAQKELVTMLLWLPLHITCTYLESLERITGRSVKGDHNYQGNLDHLIAYHQYLCAYAGDTGDGNLRFERLSLFYLKELPEAPPSLWDAALHPRLSDFVFDDTKPDVANVRALVEHASGRLVALYREKTRHLVRIAKGLAPEHPAAAFNSDADAFFIDLRETQRFLERLDGGRFANSIKHFIDHAGAAAVLWQNHRYLAREPNLQALVTDWLNVLLAREFGNVAEDRPQLTVYQAQLLYNMQCMLRPELLLGSRAALGSGAEVELLARVDNEAVLEGIEASPRCSVWKAAHRLRGWNFTAPPGALIPMHVGAPAVVRARRARLAALLRSPAPVDYPALGFRTPALDAVFGPDPARARPPLALLLRPPQPVKASLSNWASLRARLISSRLAMTALRSDSPVGCHAAPNRVAIRRGCGGRNEPSSSY